MISSALSKIEFMFSFSILSFVLRRFLILIISSSAKSPSSLAIYKESLWVGSSETGLYEYDLEKLNLIKHYQFDINDPNRPTESLRS